MNAKKKQADEKAQPAPIKLVKLNKAYKLAMQWVNNMSEDKPTEVELEGRPYKLGLGAEISHRTEVKYPNNEANEWKLRAMVDPSKRKTSIHEESTPNRKKTSHRDSEEEVS